MEYKREGSVKTNKKFVSFGEEHKGRRKKADDK